MSAGPPVPEDAPVVVRRARAAAAGTQDAPRVLLLHGLASSSSSWEALLPLLDPACEVWTADLPWRGAGVDGWWEPAPATWADRAIRAVPGGPDVVVAHSFGAGALLGWLDARCDAPDADVASPRGVVLASPFYRAAAEDFAWDTISYYLNHFDKILEDGVRVRSAGRLSEDVQHLMALKVRDRVGCHGWMRFFDTYLKTPTLRTQAMRLPVRIIAGADDFAAFPRDALALGEALLDASVHVLDDTGHFSMVERPEVFADLTNALIHDVSVPARPGHLSALEYN
ncbi:alpha/beta fold hydrolase [Streptomyces sp. GSL17-111]|uniref:alpha/beta fold hydrolase n=1 Tax=Streptomyces sp. GSL17-111 TaxID=3121596 RepID=UPI0030F3FF2B